MSVSNWRFRGILDCWDIRCTATADFEAWELKIITISAGIQAVMKDSRMALVIEKQLKKLRVRFVYRCNSLHVPHGADIFRLRQVTEAAYLLGASTT